MLKNPSYYQAGFWMTYLLEGRTQLGRSTEDGKYTPTKVGQAEQVLTISYEHRPDMKNSTIRSTTRLWSRNQPFLLLRHTSLNVGDKTVKDLKLYYIADFDLGGPDSYKDDSGRLNPQTGEIELWDDSPVFVKLSARPQVDAWDVTGPIRLRPNKIRRDLRNNTEMESADVAAAIQWNCGDLEPDQAMTVDIVIAAGRDREEATSATEKAWEIFDRKIQ